ncbi:acyl-protein synthetase [Streptomyces sp. NPDC051940]|uniref:LuxE/PaaK family acyltransferase n=1 Tax=Streptomyces sp. NPDC051940 TaxID=3155675 RepID=UPI00343713FE
MSVFTLPQAERERLLVPELAELTEYHRRASAPYRNLLAALGHSASVVPERMADLPWLPVGLLRERDFSSLAPGRATRSLSTSGTTGAPTRIALDPASAAGEMRQVVRTLQEVTGPRRLPMLIADSRDVLRSGTALSMRAGLVRALMQLGRDHVFLLDGEGGPDAPAARAFLAEHGGGPFLLCGVTALVWELGHGLAHRHGLDLTHGIVLHGGGWKRLADRAVDRAEFRDRFRRDTGATRIHDYYGMTEQGGTLFLEGPEGDGLYCPDFADVIVREPVSWQEATPGTPGVIQVVSTVPRSHPGHLLLTEDWGVVHGVDDGYWPGKRFSVLGRLPRTRARGCSDTSGTAQAAA